MTTIPTASVFTVEPAPKIVRPRRNLLTPLPEPGHFLLVIDNSSAEKFVTCPTSANFYLVHGREAHARNSALVFGGAIHAGLESLLKGDPDEVQDQRILRHFTENPAPTSEDYRTPMRALEVLRHYRQRATFPDYVWELQSDSSGPLIERAFELPLGVIDVGCRIRTIHPNQWGDGVVDETEGGVWVDKIHVAWSGRTDAVAHCNNAVRVVDHKTTSIAGDQVSKDFFLSNQTIGYVWAAQQLWPELNVSGFCVNFIHLKRPAAGAGLMDRGPRGGEPALNFFRSYFDYTPERIRWWENNALLIVSDFIQCLVRNEFPSHTKWCFGKYGQCPYHDVCSIDDLEAQLRVLHSDMYKSVTWNPVRD